MNAPQLEMCRSVPGTAEGDTLLRWEMRGVNVAGVFRKSIVSIPLEMCMGGKQVGNSNEINLEGHLLQSRSRRVSGC